MRFLRALLLITVSFVASGAPQVLAASLDDDCCHGPCDGSPTGKTCPPNCDQGACARVHPSIVAPEQSGPGPSDPRLRKVVLAQTSPRLPLVTAGVFHPPRA